MAVTSIPSASRHWETIWPKRPKPITSTDPLASEKSSGSRTSGAENRRMSSFVSEATNGPKSMVIAAMAVRMLACRLSSTSSEAPSGMRTNANSPAPVSTEPARSASPRCTHVARNNSQTISALSTVIQYGCGEDQPKIGAHNGEVDAHADPHEEQGQQKTTEWFYVGFQFVPVIRFGEQQAGKKSAECHGRPGLLHDESRAKHDEQRGRRHHLARAGLRQQPEQRIKQVASRENDQGD